MQLTTLLRAYNIKSIRGKVKIKVFNEGNLPLVLGLRDRLNNLIYCNECHKIFDDGTDKSLRFPPTKNQIFYTTSFKTAYYSVVIRARIYATNQALKNKEKEEQILLLNKLEDADLNRVTIQYMLSAWLTIDEFRWHSTFGYGEIPEDLCYGLVLNYPNYVLSYANYVMNTHLRPTYIQELSEEELVLCDRMLEATLASF
jgi:hypothetical protein